tara:strand:+ start:163 stop:345 length:183 start_codon:yes stop_codon:yes gene_type:complete
MSRMGNYLIESEENGVIRYDDRYERYIHQEPDIGGQHSSAKRSEARDGGETAPRTQGSDE